MRAARGQLLMEIHERRELAAAAETVASAALIGAPLALGMAHLSSTLVISALGLIAFGLLVAARGWRLPHLGLLPLLLLGVCAAIALQLVPLPARVLAAIAPEAFRIGEIALGPAAGWGGMRPISLDLPATAAELAKWAGWTAIAWVLWHRVRTARGARDRLLRYVGSAAAAVALIGLFHFLVGERRVLFGLYEFQASNAFRSTFGNSNHLAGFLVLGGLLALGIAAGSELRRARLGWGALFILCAAGTFLSASRGGFVALIAGLIFLLALGWGGRRSGEDGGWQSGLTLGFATTAAAGVGIWIYLRFPRLLREVASLLNLDPASEEGKLEALLSGWRAAQGSWLTGIGRGAFGTVGALYQENPFPGIWFTHVENEPVQALAELGFPVGGGLLLGLFAVWIGLALRGRRSWAEAGAAAGVFALCLQNLADFSLQHACGLAALCLLAYPAGARARRDEVSETAGIRAALAHPAAGIAAICLAVIGFGWASIRAWPGLDADSDRLLATAKDASMEEFEALVRDAFWKRPADYLPVDLMASRLLSEPGNAEAAMPWINRLRILRPFGTRGHVLAGVALSELGRGRQALRQFRRAATLGTRTIDEVVARYQSREAILEGAPQEGDPARVAALRLSQLGKRDEGILVAKRALEKSPDDDGLLAALSSLQAAAGEREEAWELARKRRSLRPDLDGAWAGEAAALTRLGRRDEARDTYREGLEQHAGSPALIFGLAQLELDEKRADQALLVLARLRSNVPTGSRVRYHELRARAFRAERSLLRARDELRMAVRLAPDREPLRIALANTLLELGRTEEAAAEVAKLGESPAAEAARDRLERQRKREQEAKEALQRERLERASRGR